MNQIYYNLFLDDDVGRIPHKLSWIVLPLVNWTFVRNYNEFISIITKNGLPENISFDHDLGESAYKECYRAHNSDGIIRYENIVERTGYDAAKWLIEYCSNKNLDLPNWSVHSFNPVGRENIISLLQSYEKFRSHHSEKSSESKPSGKENVGCERVEAK